jgi:hypothetical protein
MYTFSRLIEGEIASCFGPENKKQIEQYANVYVNKLSVFPLIFPKPNVCQAQLQSLIF